VLVARIVDFKEGRRGLHLRSREVNGQMAGIIDVVGIPNANLTNATRAKPTFWIGVNPIGEVQSCKLAYG